MDNSEKPHVVVLAAGRGRRMGGPKALMDVGGRVWWQVQSERLDRIGLPQLWVVGPETAAALRGRVPIVEGNPDAPMFASMLAALEELKSIGAGMFVLPVDVPAAGAEVWTALAEQAAPAAPRIGKARGHPVFLPREWVERVLRPAAERADAELLRLDQLIGHEMVTVEVADADVRVNLNTPEDLRDFVLAHGDTP